MLLYLPTAFGHNYFLIQNLYCHFDDHLYSNSNQAFTRLPDGFTIVIPEIVGERHSNSIMRFSITPEHVTVTDVYSERDLTRQLI